MRNTSLYWDDFEMRIHETIESLKQDKKVPVRRVSVFITGMCNFHCKYCNHQNGKHTLPEVLFREVLNKYGDTAIIHITGGEPLTVHWLYSFLKANGDKYRFHLNTNAYILPPFESVRRLKISLDHYEARSWDYLVGHKGAFKKVCKHIKESAKHTTTSLTYVLTKESYRRVIDFARFTNQEFSELYALFFSVYKGTNPAFILTKEDANCFFLEILPRLEEELSTESLALLHETIDDKRRLIQGLRFPENITNNCYLSMSERVISPTGKEFNCSHLYRDGIYHTTTMKHEKCLYGCNLRLVKFNEQVEAEVYHERPSMR